MKRILVTGGTGFIGSHLVHHLLSLNMDVWVYDKAIHKPTFHDISKASFIEGDVLSTELLYDCLQHVDTCFHLAALSAVAVCRRDWLFSHENNVIAFNGLLEQLQRLKKPIKLVYASSAAVYGNSDQLPLTESQHVIPRSAYGADKLSNEMYAAVAREIFGIPSIGLRFFNVYGPGQLKSNPYSGVITAFKLALDEDKPLTIFGNGKQTRDFIYVNDVIDALIKAANLPYESSGIFNICTGSSISIEELATMMIRLTGKKVPIIYQEARPDDLLHSLGSPVLAEEQLHFKAKTPMDRGIDSFLKEHSF